MKTCCVCKTPLPEGSRSYPRFETDPANPELICIPCLPGEFVATFKRQPKMVRDLILQYFQPN